MFTRILVPLDGTPEAEAALPPASALAEKFGATVVLLEVTPGYGQMVAATAAEPFGAPVYVAGAADLAVQIEEAASEYLDQVRTRAGNPRWETMIAEGDSATAIADRAKAVSADLIVMATHGRSGLKRLFLGSVVDDVLKRCEVPVLVVHREEHDD